MKWAAWRRSIPNERRRGLPHGDQVHFLQHPTPFPSFHMFFHSDLSLLQAREPALTPLRDLPLATLAGWV